MLTHCRNTAESKSFWGSMGMKPASRFTAQLVDVDGAPSRAEHAPCAPTHVANSILGAGGDWGWSDTTIFELPVEHMAHVPHYPTVKLRPERGQGTQCWPAWQVSDTLNRIYRRPFPFSTNLNAACDGMVVWARVRKAPHPHRTLSHNFDW